MKTPQFLKDVVIVRLLEVQQIGNIVVPQSARLHHVQKGIVYALGTKCKLPLKKGDGVIVSARFGNPIKLGDETLKIYNSEDILGKVEE